MSNETDDTEKQEQHTIVVECQKCHGTQTLTMVGMTEKEVDDYCGILDGTSPMYVIPVTEDSMIGRCGICGGRYRARRVVLN